MSRCAVRVTTECGNSWVSTINLTYSGACEYYMGHRFEHLDPYTRREVLWQPVSSVELIKVIES